MELEDVVRERDALAAHIERLRKAYEEAEFWEDVHDVFNESPDLSLVERDKEQQKIGAASFRHELMESMRVPMRPHIQGVFSVWLCKEYDES